MATIFYFKEVDAGVSGEYIATTQRGNSVVEGIVDTVSGGTSIPWTRTRGGVPLSFVTKPLAQAVTIAGSITVNMWAKESNLQANAGAQMKIYKLSGGTKTLIATLTRGVELTATFAAQNFSDTPTSTVFAKGDRIVFEPCISNVGTMGNNRFVTMAYGGATAAVSGDTYISIFETIVIKEKAITT